MVLLHVSRATEEFIVEAPTTTSIDTLTRTIAAIHNKRLRIKRLTAQVRELAKYGPMKAEEERGLSDEQLNALGSEVKEVAGADPLGVRVGEAPNERLQAVLVRVCDEADAAVSVAHAKARRVLPVALVDACLDNLRGAVTMAYPQQLPEHDAVRSILEQREQLSQHEDGKLQVDEDTAVVWFAGKQLERSQPLSKYVGSNEKVTVKVKLEAAGAGAPSREPAVDADTQRRVMALWHKKEAEAKALAEASDDSYLNSEWANPKGFKQAMHGLSGISYAPGRR